MTKPAQSDETLRTILAAITHDYAALARMRFTIAGLYLAATGFLASTWFAGLRDDMTSSYYLIPALGFIVTLVCWLMEIRTVQIIQNLEYKGAKIERELNVDGKLTLFMMSSGYPLQPRLPFSTKISVPSFLRRFVSHSFGLNTLYASIAVFWVLAIALG
jgi:hypothetical protein